MVSSGASAVGVASAIALSIDHQLHSAIESESRVFQIQSRVHSLPTLRTIITAGPAPAPQAQHPQTVSTKMTSDRLRSRISIYGKGIRSPSIPSSPRSRLNPTFTTSPVPPQLDPPALHSASSGSIVTEMTPSRAPCPSRDRAATQSRSSSLPSALRIHNTHPDRSSPSSGRSTPGPHGKRSVKHLTCFWWQQKGHCRFSEEDCLYAHHDTGMYTQPPRQLRPGEPAMAGRNLDRNIQKLHSERSSASLSSLNVSRPATPRAASFDSPTQTLIKSDLPTTRDSHILRDLVEQGLKETAVLISTIDSLQNENKGKVPTMAELVC